MGTPKSPKYPNSNRSDDHNPIETIICFIISTNNHRDRYVQGNFVQLAAQRLAKLDIYIWNMWSD